MRVGILGLLHESNTFLPGNTTWQHFEADVLAHGQQVRQQFATAPHEIGGFFSGLEQTGIEAVPIFAARALPYGVIVAEAFERLKQEILKGLEQAGPLDGLLVAPHGATVSLSAPDADGDWLELVRNTVGPTMPIVGTIDSHGNLSRRMTSACDVLIAYRTNPHVDQFERGIEAAQLLSQILQNKKRATMAAELLPMAVSIECQCDYEHPCRTLHELAEEIRHQPGVLSASVVVGFPYADVAEMGSSVIVVTDDDKPMAITGIDPKMRRIE